LLEVLPQLVGNRGVVGLKLAIADPSRYAIEPKVDGVRGLVAFLSQAARWRHATGAGSELVRPPVLAV
jgi:hypothetical protein